MNRSYFAINFCKNIKLILQKSAANRAQSDWAVPVMLNEIPCTASGPKWNSNETLEFNRILPDIVRDLTDTDDRYYDVDSANRWYAKLLQYNLTGGSRMRGLSLVQAYKILADRQDQTPQNIKLAQIMGWCLEILHTSLILTQDIIDQVEYRNGKPCWYLQSPRHQPDEAARLLQNAVFILLKKHFQNTPFYVDAIELFHDIGHKSLMGMVLQLETERDETMEHFTMDRYSSIAKYKTSYHSFKLPVSLALYMANIRDLEIHRQARTILLEMGHFYQVLKDYSNCFGGEECEIGSDIKDGKCTWLSVVAMQRVSKKQKKLLVENYGSDDPKKVETVKHLYIELGLPSTFKLYKDRTHDLICTHIQQISRGLPHNLFFMFLKRLFPLQLQNNYNK